MKNGISYPLQGAFCQFEFEGKTTFVEVNTCEYSQTKIERLKQIGSLDQSIIGSFLQLIPDTIPENTQFLYKLESYNANKEIKSAWEFNESITNFQVKAFSSIDDLLAYCSETWSIEATDFTSRDKTDIP